MRFRLTIFSWSWSVCNPNQALSKAVMCLYDTALQIRKTELAESHPFTIVPRKTEEKINRFARTRKKGGKGRRCWRENLI
ncbi:hypothetical protein GQ43DRAFT_38424 [Delitschia confertaspora ATCC 74209]|uniref:Uncharacterized protein n=1 Tax=Delitschia confertaspora ATCC 74209 TaxID=1513339 RepID=A0A9P4JKY1_9PLEO|nr:hypothetical protein GQ43DRAFT_38424 [Delitschia confertaspora ATCC 74209]